MPRCMLKFTKKTKDQCEPDSEDHVHGYRKWIMEVLVMPRVSLPDSAELTRQ